MRLNTLALISMFLCQTYIGTAQSNSQFVVAENGVRPAISVDNSRRVGIVWSDNSHYAIYYKRLDSEGGTLMDTVRISLTSGSPGVEQPSIAATGGFELVVWRKQASFNSYIIGRLIDTMESVAGGEEQINDNFSDAQRFRPRVADMNDTTLAIVWNGDGPQTAFSASGIYAQTISTQAERGGSNVLLSDDTLDTKGNSNPMLAVRRDLDTLVVVWLDGGSRGNKIMARAFDKSLAPLGQSWLVTEDTSFTYFWSPSAGIDLRGNVSIAWAAERNDGLWNVYLLMYDRQGNPMGPVMTVDLGANFDWVPEVRLSIDDEGKMVIVWESVAGEKIHIKGQRFNSQGNPVGGNFFISSPTDTINQLYPEVVLKNDNIYVVWQRHQNKVLARFIDFYDPSLYVEEVPATNPTDFHLFQNYPNPFNPSTTISFILVREGPVDLTIFDIMGKEVAKPFTGNLHASFHSFVWDVKNSPEPVTSGAYFCRLATGRSSQTIKLLFIQ